MAGWLQKGLAGVYWDDSDGNRDREQRRIELDRFGRWWTFVRITTLFTTLIGESERL